jgi:hypothetical protein
MGKQCCLFKTPFEISYEFMKYRDVGVGMEKRKNGDVYEKCTVS